MGFAHKMALYKALANNGKNNMKVRVQDAIPADLINDKRELEKIGSRWRKENPELRTKVLCRNGEVSLYTKEKDEKKYSKVSKEAIDLENDFNSAQPSRAASPFPMTRSGRGGAERGRGAYHGPRSGKRPRSEDYDFSRFAAN